jgi:serine/threonine protein kinase
MTHFQDNILLKEDWSIRLADFGNSSLGHIESNEYCGTVDYMPPEIYIGTAQMKLSMFYSPITADIWSAGITSFIVMWGVPPVKEASQKCWFFRQICQNEWAQFW